VRGEPTASCRNRVPAHSMSPTPHPLLPVSLQMLNNELALTTHAFACDADITKAVAGSGFVFAACYTPVPGRTVDPVGLIRGWSTDAPTTPFELRVSGTVKPPLFMARPIPLPSPSIRRRRGRIGATALRSSAWSWWTCRRARRCCCRDPWTPRYACGTWTATRGHSCVSNCWRGTAEVRAQCTQDVPFLACVMDGRLGHLSIPQPPTHAPTSQG